LAKAGLTSNKFDKCVKFTYKILKVIQEMGPFYRKYITDINCWMVNRDA